MTYGHDLSKPQSLGLLEVVSGGPFRTFLGLARQALKLIPTWMERRRQRRDLAWLDDRLLKDVGISREAAAREISKSFWR